MKCPLSGWDCPGPGTSIVGVRCPKCGALNLRVVETSHAARGIIRLRECGSCGSVRIQTVEIVLNTKPRGRGHVRGRYPPLPREEPRG